MTIDELNIFLSVKLAESGKVTQAKAAEILETPASNFSRKLKKGTFSYLEIVKLAEGLDYKIEWVKKQ